jgi:hypothetical protein
MSITAGALLAGLDTVDWAGLHHAYGPAVDVPDQLRALLSADDATRHEAHHRLGGNVTAWTEAPDPDVAAGAAELLAWFPATRLAVPRLPAIPEGGGREAARASANLSLGYLAPGEPAIDQRLGALLSAGTFAVRLTAAVALALRLGDRLPDAGLQVLAEARDHADEIGTAAFPIPWDRSLLGFAALALYRIGLSP